MLGLEVGQHCPIVEEGGREIGRALFRVASVTGLNAALKPQPGDVIAVKALDGALLARLIPAAAAVAINSP